MSALNPFHPDCRHLIWTSPYFFREVNRKTKLNNLIIVLIYKIQTFVAGPIKFENQIVKKQDYPLNTTHTSDKAFMM